jgi:hypothetical protein
MPMFSDTQTIGTGLLGLGLLFVFLGVVLLFDRTLLTIGNVLFLSGLCITMGFSRTTRFFRKKARDMGFRGVACFAGGIFMVLVMRWPIFGIILEGFGFINLFGNFFPIALAAMRTMPVIGDFLRLPGISFVADKLAGGQSKRANQWA